MLKKFLFAFFILIFLMPEVQAANFSFDAGGSLRQSCSETISVMMNTDGEIANSADAFIKYNSSQITVDDVLPGTAFNFYSDPIIDPDSGLIKFTGYGGKLSGKGTFAYLRLRTNPGVSNTRLSWDFTFGSTTDSNIGRRSDAVDILTDVTNGNFDFGTGVCEQDKDGPIIDNQTPGPGASNQPLDSEITFTISDIDSGVDINSLIITITNNGITTSYDSSKFTYTERSSNKSYDIKIIPYPSFVSGEPVFIDYTAKDLKGNVGRGGWDFNNANLVYECKYLSLVAIPGNKKVNLAWTGVSSLGFENILIKRSPCGQEFNFPSTPSDGDQVYDGPDSYTEDNGTANSTQYCYSAFAYKNTDDGKQFSQGAFAVATPSCYVQPLSNLSLNPSDSGIQLSWNKPDIDNLGSIKIIRKENGCPSGWIPNGWNIGSKVVYDGTGSEFFDSGAKDKNYCYLALVNDDQGCFSPGVLAATSLGYEPSSDGFVPDYDYFTNNGILPLTPDGGRLDLLAGKDLTISTKSKFTKPVENIIAQIGENMYTFSYDANSRQYSLILNNFNKVGVSEGKLMVVYTDKTTQETPFYIGVDDFGSIYSGIAGLKSPLSDVEVGLYKQNGDMFVGVNQKNPVSTNASGSYGFMVPNGSYKIIIKKNGETQFESDVFNVNNNIVNYDVNVVIQSVVETVIPKEVQKAVVSTVQQTARQVDKIVKTEEVQKTNKIVVAPTIAAIATANLVTAVPWWNFWYYLQYMFTEFIPWLLFRKRKGWGVIYNSITKKPIDLAVVRLYNATTNKLVKTKITDKHGRYMFLVEAGNYYLKISKQGFEFPSAILKNATYDKDYIDIYHGEEIKIGTGEKGAIIANIPLDQAETQVTNAQVLKNYFWNTLRKNLSIVGPLLSLIALLVSPSWVMVGFTIFHIALFFLFRRLASKDKIKYWGVVYDAGNRRPLARAIAKIYSPEYNRMLEAYVTDKYGRYGFLASSDVYYITGEKPGYNTLKTEQIDISKSGSGEVVGKDLPLQKQIAPVSGVPIKEKEIVVENVKTVQVEPIKEPVEIRKSETDINPENSQNESIYG